MATSALLIIIVNYDGKDGSWVKALTANFPSRMNKKIKKRDRLTKRMIGIGERDKK